MTLLGTLSDLPEDILLKTLFDSPKDILLRTLSLLIQLSLFDLSFLMLFTNLAIGPSMAKPRVGQVMEELSFSLVFQVYRPKVTTWSKEEPTIVLYGIAPHLYRINVVPSFGIASFNQ